MNYYNNTIQFGVSNDMKEFICNKRGELGLSQAAFMRRCVATYAATVDNKVLREKKSYKQLMKDARRLKSL